MRQLIDHDYQVLLVEDNPDFRDLYCFYSRQAKLKTLAAKNGTEALQYLREQTFDCILLDYMLPDYSGLEIVEIINSDPLYEQNKDCKIVAVSAIELPQQMLANLYNAGVSLFLSKTFALKEMVQVITNFCFASTVIRNTKEQMLVEVA
ncbi:response regulator [candidate division KSB1 bacterium]|nr:response regulator [candidate division KSB1 bacterium]